MQISAQSTASDIRLRRDVFTGAFLVVEGSSDGRFYEGLVDHSHCHVISAGGKDRVIEVITTLTNEGFPGVLGIMDSDYDAIMGAGVPPANVVTTDEHDLELMLLMSRSFDKVLREHASPQKIARVESEWGVDIRTGLLTRTSPLGRLRWISQRDSLNLKFEGLEVSRFVDQRTLDLDSDRMIRTVLNLSQRQDLMMSDLVDQVRSDVLNLPELTTINCGHDVIQVLSIGLRRLIGSERATDCAPTNLERELRLGYEAAYFANTELRKRVAEWESTSGGYSLGLRY